MLKDIEHSYQFDPTHGYTLERFLSVGAPDGPEDFEGFWEALREDAFHLDPISEINFTGNVQHGWKICDWSYRSSGNVRIRGWVLLPVSGIIRRGFVIGHGYGGRLAPDFDYPFEDAVLFFPCSRGLGRSEVHGVPSDSYKHVLYKIESKENYILRGCVEDLWMGVTSALRLFPQIEGHLGYLGVSFGGGIGVLAIPWEERIQMAHFKVPTFGNHPLRMELATVGSAASIQRISKYRPEALETLRYFDAAVAARYLRIPVLCACALFDPVVAPAGQFAIYNQITSPKELFLLSAGHHSYPDEKLEESELWRKLNNFYRDL